MRKIFLLPLLIITFFLITVSSISAQELQQETEEVYRARIIKIINEETIEVEGTDVENISQEIVVKILNKDKEGDRVQFTNDYIKLDQGDVIFVNYLQTNDGQEIYSVAEPDRRGVLSIFAVIFVATFLLFAGWRGLRPLLSLVGVFVVIFTLLVPMLLSGAPPVLTSVLFSIVIMAIVMFVTHGFSPSTVAAYLGTTTTLIIASVLAQIAVTTANLSGFGTDAAIYLNINTDGALNLSGILLGSIIIGAIGVLDDIAITQTALTGELKLANPSLSRSELFTSAMRVGREHISALVNTLALAYAGASLPLLLLFSLSDLSPLLLINREIFAVEVVRTLVGSIGLIIAVPLTTWFAILLINKEDKTLEGHSHHH
ncbi:MAG: YibE/F family protein [Candidatus Campbellbacteria bacterium]|nr:YibE/F family protein [Candidatus Campbellbacteria bacterium]